MTNLESDGTHISQVCWYTNLENAWDWLDENQLTDGNHTLLEVKVNVFSLFQLESVNGGHPDHISETRACWSFRVLLTGLASKVQSPYEEEC